MRLYQGTAARAYRRLCNALLGSVRFVRTLGVNALVHDLHQFEENAEAVLASLNPRNLYSVLLEVTFTPLRDVDLESVASGNGDNLMRNGI
jgi:hypothetical protein